MTSSNRHQQMEERAFEFHQDNPQVWRMFCEYTFELIARGFRHYSAQHGVFARIRWESDSADANGNNTFKINNNWSAFYARWFMAAYPEYAGFYRLRAQTSQNAPAINAEELGPKDFNGEYGAAKKKLPNRPVTVPEQAQQVWASKPLPSQEQGSTRAA